MSHHAHVINSLKELLIHMNCANNGRQTDREKRRRAYWTRVWKAHVEKHGNVPLIMKCAICSGKEFKDDVKSGRWKPSRPNKAERDEEKS